mmetsp:Transcript_5090/g.8886  ORF Transcript_5090/g.8886 Transcript_5090/m.8886 type:complete len:100 (-) Transcript_5090:126-425(-)
MSSSQASQTVSRGGSGATGAAAPSGLRKRAPPGATSAGSSSKPSARPAGMQNNAAQGLFSLRLYNDDAPGLRVGPTAVLVFSLVYIASVVLLHVWAKLR